MLSVCEVLPEIARKCRESDWLSESCDWLTILNANLCRSGIRIRVGTDANTH